MGPTGSSIQSRLASLIQNTDRSVALEGDLTGGPVLQSLLNSRTVSNDGPLTQGKFEQLKTSNFVRTAKQSIQSELNKGPFTEKIINIQASMIRKDITAEALVKKMGTRMMMVNSKLYDLKLEIDLLGEMEADPALIENKQRDYQELSDTLSAFLDKTESTLDKKTKGEIHDRIFSGNKGLTEITDLGYRVQSAWKNIQDDGIKGRLNEAVFIATADIARRATDLKPNALSAYFDTLEVDPNAEFTEFEQFFNTASRAPDHLLIMDDGGGRAMSATGDGGQVVGSMTSRDVSINTGTQNATIAGTGHTFHGPVNIYTQGAAPADGANQAAASSAVGAVGGVDSGAAGKVSKEELLQDMIAATGNPDITSSEELLELIEQEFAGTDFLSTSDKIAAAEKFANKLLTVEGDRTRFVEGFTALMSGTGPKSFDSALSSLNHFLSGNFISESASVERLLDLIDDVTPEAQDLLTRCLENTGVSVADLKAVLQTHLSGLTAQTTPASFVTNNEEKISTLLGKLNQIDQSHEARLLQLALNNLYDTLEHLAPSAPNISADLSWCEHQLYILGLDSFQEIQEITNRISTIPNSFNIDNGLVQKAQNLITSNQLSIFTEVNASDDFFTGSLEGISRNLAQDANRRQQLTALFSLLSNLSQAHAIASPSARAAITDQANQALKNINLTPQEFYNICCMDRFFDLSDPLNRNPVADLYNSLPDSFITGQNIHGELLNLRALVESIFEDTPNPINTKQGSSAHFRFNDLIDAAKAGSKGSTDDLANGIKNMLKVIEGKSSDSAFLQDFPIGHVGTHHFAEKFHYDVKNEHRGSVHFEPRNISNAMQNFMRIANLPQNQQDAETMKLRDFIKANLADYDISPAFFESAQAQAPLTDDEKTNQILETLVNNAYSSLSKMSPQNMQAGRYSDYLLGTDLTSLTSRETGVAKRVFNLEQFPPEISDPLLYILTDFTDVSYVNNDIGAKNCLDEFYFDINARPKDGQDGKDGQGISLADLNARIKAAVDAKGAEIEDRFRDLEAGIETSLNTIKYDVDQLRLDVEDQGQELLRLNGLVSAREAQLDGLIFNANAKDLIKQNLADNLNTLIQDQASSQDLKDTATTALTGVNDKGDYFTVEEMTAFNNRLITAATDEDKLTVMADLTNDLNQRTGEIPSVRIQIEELTSELGDLRRAQADVERQMEENAQKLVEHGNLINENKSGVDALNLVSGRVDGLEATTNELLAKVDGLSGEVNDLNQNLQTVASKITTLETGLDDLRAGLTDQIREALTGMLSEPDMRALIENIIKDLVNSGGIGDIPAAWMNQINQLLQMHPALDIITQLDTLMEGWFMPDPNISASPDLQRRTYAAEALNRLIQMYPQLEAIIRVNPDDLPPPPPQDVPSRPQTPDTDYRLRNWTDLDMAPADAQFDLNKALLENMNLLASIKNSYAASPNKENFKISALQHSNLTRGGFFDLPHIVLLKPEIKAAREAIRKHNQAITEQMATGATPQAALQEYPELTTGNYTEIGEGDEFDPAKLNDYAVEWRNVQTYATGADNAKDLMKDLTLCIEDGIDPFLVTNLPSVQLYKTENLDDPALPRSGKRQKYKTVTTATVKADMLRQLRQLDPASMSPAEKANYVISGAVANSPLLENWGHAYTPAGNITDTKDPLAPFASEFLLLLQSNFDNSKNLMPIGGTAFASPWSWALLREVARAGVQGAGGTVVPHKSFAQLMTAFNNVPANERNAFITSHRALADTNGISVYQLFDIKEINRQRFPLSENQTNMMNEIIDKTNNT